MAIDITFTSYLVGESYREPFRVTGSYRGPYSRGNGTDYQVIYQERNTPI